MIRILDEPIVIPCPCGDPLDRTWRSGGITIYAECDRRLCTGHSRMHGGGGPIQGCCSPEVVTEGCQCMSPEELRERLWSGAPIQYLRE
jgi:hypothetical protein